MQHYKIVSADLDMTLLSSDMTLSPENEEAIRVFREKGIHFVPNTGRTFSEIPLQIRKNPDIRYVIYSDGAAIYDKETDSTEGAYIPQELYRSILRLLGEYETLSTVRTGGVSYADDEQFNEECMICHQVGKYYRDHLFQTNVPVKNFNDFCQSAEDVEMICTFFKDDEECRDFCARLEELGGVTIVSSIPHNIEILSENAGKGKAMLRLAKRLGITQEETLSVGDSKNDVDMIRAAGLGIAMKNAWEVLKEEADTVAECTNDGHVAKYLLEKYFDV